VAHEKRVEELTKEKEAALTSARKKQIELTQAEDARAVKKALDVRLYPVYPLPSRGKDAYTLLSLSRSQTFCYLVPLSLHRTIKPPSPTASPAQPFVETLPSDPLNPSIDPSISIREVGLSRHLNSSRLQLR